MTITLDTLTLPPELVWQDEYIWGQARSTAKRSIQGILIVRENLIPDEGGRYITLTSDNAWMLRSDLDILRSWTDELAKVMTLTLHDLRTYQCRFRHWDSPCVGAETVLSGLAYPEAGTYYKLSLNLLVI